MTRLEAFMKAHKIKPGKLAEEACISTRRLRRIRREGTRNLPLLVALRIRDACRRLSGRYIQFEEVFEME
jgi:hypothetical protein